MLTRRDFLKSAFLATGAAWACPATAAVFPYIQNLGRNKACVVWKAYAPAAGAVEFSDNPFTSVTVAARMKEFPSNVTGLTRSIYLYRAELTDLKPSTEYRYRVLLN